MLELLQLMFLAEQSSLSGNWAGHGEDVSLNFFKLNRNRKEDYMRAASPITLRISLSAGNPSVLASASSVGQQSVEDRERRHSLPVPPRASSPLTVGGIACLLHLENLWANNIRLQFLTTNN